MRRPAGRGVLPGDGGVDLGVLRLTGPTGFEPRLGRRPADQHHRGRPPALPPLLRIASGARRPAPRRRDPVFPQAGRAADAPGRHRRHLPAPGAGLHPPRPRRQPGRGPRQAPVRRRGPGPAVGHGRHRAPDRRGQGVPGCRARRVEPASGRLVDRRPRPSRARGRRRADGRLAATAAEGPVRGALRPRQQYTSWAFGTRLRAAGPLGSMGSVGDAYDNSLAESFFHTLQLELLDEHRWTSRRELALAIFEWIECWYNPSRRHSSLQMLSPRRLRSPLHAHRCCGMITAANPSAGPGEAQSGQDRPSGLKPGSAHRRGGASSPTSGSKAP